MRRDSDAHQGEVMPEDFARPGNEDANAEDEEDNDENGVDEDDDEDEEQDNVFRPPPLPRTSELEEGIPMILFVMGCSVFVGVVELVCALLGVPSIVAMLIFLPAVVISIWICQALWKLLRPRRPRGD